VDRDLAEVVDPEQLSIYSESSTRTKIPLKVTTKKISDLLAQSYAAPVKSQDIQKALESLALIGKARKLPEDEFEIEYANLSIRTGDEEKAVEIRNSGRDVAKQFSELLERAAFKQAHAANPKRRKPGPEQASLF
jgi:hypothetical protein